MTSTTDEIARLKKVHNAIILAHTYQPGEIQDIADFVGDSYGLSVQAAAADAEVIIFCGVLFMAETAAILNPDKKVILPVPEAGCPMADMISAGELVELKRKYPGYTVLCYVNSPAEVKAESDICCTSSNALTIAGKLPENKGIIFVPDKHLGSHVHEQTGRPVVLWEGFCPTHARITPAMVLAAKKNHPRACTMIHPEAPKASRDLCDKIFSTGQMCDFVKEGPHTEFIIGTEIGILHTLNHRTPQKKYYPMSDQITCPNMRRGTLETTLRALKRESGLLVNVSGDIADKARGSLTRMLEMSR
ncbi:MAG: quinolinate synthase NadA [Chitinivibrionales bacterium]|nr:quinolinate synthase NadA [Chitinivibrionales bacterium]